VIQPSHQRTKADAKNFVLQAAESFTQGVRRILIFWNARLSELRLHELSKVAVSHLAALSDEHPFVFISADAEVCVDSMAAMVRSLSVIRRDSRST
jgi:hypothetical protein